jgi:hypothetical protein
MENAIKLGPSYITDYRNFFSNLRRILCILISNKNPFPPCYLFLSLFLSVSGLVTRQTQAVYSAKRSTCYVLL